MKIHSMGIANVLSFKDMPETEFNSDINILIGPNRGGKSNLLDIIDIIIQKYFVKSYSVKISKDSKIIKEEKIFSENNNPLKNYYGDDRAKIVMIKLRCEASDVGKIRSIYDNRDAFISENHNFVSEPTSIFSSFSVEEVDLFRENQIIEYNVNVDNTSPGWKDDDGRHFYRYLKSHFYYEILSNYIDDVKIDPIFLYFPPYRNQNQEFSLNLSSQDFLLSRSQYSKSYSKKGSSISKASLSIIAEKRRRYEIKDNTEGLWNTDPAISELKTLLKEFDYNFRLDLSDHIRNWYDLIIIKDGKEHIIEDASSGEKEIFNFLLGITALNVRDGIIIIDEPELHLHPSWQRRFVDIIMKISKERNIQFFISTHSPSMITSDTIEYVYRIYGGDNGSKIIPPKDIGTLKIKDLVHLVNTQNNEKIFFAELVILVEGISDRIIFSSLIELYTSIFGILKSIEIVEVYGKNNFEKYRNLLNQFKINNSIIADYDYTADIAGADIKQYLTIDQSKVVKALTGSNSKDKKTMIMILKESLQKGDFDKANEFLSYVESRCVTCLDDIKEKDDVIKFIDSKKSEKIFILKKGVIEDYLPEDVGKHNIERLIEYVKPDTIIPSVIGRKDEPSQIEIDEIIMRILGIPFGRREEIYTALEQKVGG